MKKIILLFAFLICSFTTFAEINPQTYYIIFPNLNMGQSWQITIDEMLGYPMGGSLHAFQLYEHPVLNDSCLAIITPIAATADGWVEYKKRIVNVYDEILTAEEKGLLKDEAYMQANGWWGPEGPPEW